MHLLYPGILRIIPVTQKHKYSMRSDITKHIYETKITNYQLKHTHTELFR